MTSSLLRASSQMPRSGFDFADVDPFETSRAWSRFLANRHAPSLPVTGVRKVIYQSWVRSDGTGIRPEQFAAPSLEPGAMATKNLSDKAELRRAAHATMVRIGDLLSGAEAMLLLTDRDGVVLETVGDKSTLTKAGKINLMVDGVWSESASGTNGIGTALWMGQPVYVHGEEHFCEGMKGWSCAAAPIRDPIDHSIIGVVNLSGLTGIFQKHNAAFAATAARDIELILEQDQSLLNIRLMEAIIGKFPAHVQDPSEGLAIVDRFGRLIFNRNSGIDVGRPDRDLGLGARFLELPDGISEDRILAALPDAHNCEDIRLIEIDGLVKGAALSFRPGLVARHSAASHCKKAPPLPGVTIRNSGLKIVGQSEVILTALDTAYRISTLNEPILIEGQTGVGKDLFAQLIHAHSDPHGKHPFRPINCGAATPQLFGTALGAPDAAMTAPICLDEIGEATPKTQLFLLRILEDRLSRARATDGREPAAQVLSLTNRTMRDEVEAGRFRRDLFYRIGALVLTIPPLQARGEDVLLIAEHYNRKLSDESGRDRLVLGSDVEDALMAHSWPGNVRELRNLMAWLHGMASSRVLSLADLPSEITNPAKTVPADMFAPRRNDAENDPSLRHAEAALIENVLRLHQGNLSKAAIALGISRPTLYRKIKAYGSVTH